MARAGANSSNPWQHLVAGTSDRIVLTIGLAVIAALALATLFYALMHHSPEPDARSSLLTGTAPPRQLELAPGLVEAYLRQDLEALPQVQEALPHVHSNRGAVEADLTLLIRAGSNTPDTIVAIRKITVDALRSHLGFARVRTPRLRIITDERSQAGLPFNGEHERSA